VDKFWGSRAVLTKKKRLGIIVEVTIGFCMVDYPIFNTPGGLRAHWGHFCTEYSDGKRVKRVKF